MEVRYLGRTVVSQLRIPPVSLSNQNRPTASVSTISASLDTHVMTGRAGRPPRSGHRPIPDKVAKHARHTDRVCLLSHSVGFASKVCVCCDPARDRCVEFFVHDCRNEHSDDLGCDSRLRECLVDR